ncbi:YbaN family protein [Oceanicola sp. 22II-s10i]|uniref:YbaN family protein n=1 Tax=Oceanicola sp. 22II-s10i TaxID=1317116 RepID=UPI000B524D37|nr:YbaN family protein [Oceanicola sp. 22II-s10i]
MRVVWGVLGGLALLFGLVGIVLPLLPTVPFLLLAAFCFARSSDRLHSWLVEHPRFGGPIEDWRRYGAISRRGKRLATLSIGAVFLLSVVMQVPAHVLAIQAVTLGLVLTFIWTRPNGPR